MTVSALTRPHRVTVKRSDLRQNQRATLKKAKGRTVVVVTASDEGEEKLLLDKRYFEELVLGLRAAAETLEIATDERLFPRILAAAKTLDQDVRLGKLRSFREAFGAE
jgi:hypothetical protein